VVILAVAVDVAGGRAGSAGGGNSLAGGNQNWVGSITWNYLSRWVN
jgi:hypothetical protein